MSRLVADAMKQGAYGVATGLIYSPNAYAKTDELIALSRPASAAGGLYASHLRYDGEKLREGSRKRSPSAKAPDSRARSFI